LGGKQYSSSAGTEAHGLRTRVLYKLRTRVETGNTCAAPSSWSPDVECYTGSCKKTNTPQADSLFVSACSVTITHIGEDLTDNQRKNEVSYERLTPFGSPATIEMDDEFLGAGDCDLDLKFTNSWSSVSNKLTVTSKFEDSDSGGWFSKHHDYSYGYKLESSNCVIKDVVRKDCTIGSSFTSCFSPVVSGGTAEALQRYMPDATLPQIVNQSAYEYTFVGCTQNSHCTTAGKNTCDTAANVCISSVSSVPPTSKITRIEDSIEKQEPGWRFNFPTIGAYTYYLNAENDGATKKTWRIRVEDKDNAGGTSLLDTCHISVNGVEKDDRSCNDWVNFTVGKLHTGADCTIEDFRACTVRVWAKDKTGNTATTVLKLTDVLLPPKDERDYKSHNFNVFELSVDWSSPTAE